MLFKKKIILCTLLGFAILFPLLPPLIFQLYKMDEKVANFVVKNYQLQEQPKISK